MEKIPNFEKQKEIHIEKPTPDDMEGIKKVWYQTWLATYPNEESGVTRGDIEDHFKDFFTPEAIERGKEKLRNIPENESFIVAKEGDDIVGLCRMIRADEENQLQSIYVLPSSQGKGVGKKLWEEVKGKLDKDKPTYVILADYNKNARRFYEKIGFEDTGKRISDPAWQMKSGAIISDMEMVLKQD